MFTSLQTQMRFLLAGIYLLKRAFQRYCDLSFWIECSFRTALKRAGARAQEGLSPDETIAAYRTIYVPAQEIHFERDNLRAAATAAIDNNAEYMGALSLRRRSGRHGGSSRFT